MSKAIIIGGGIGGLSAAAALMRVGVECEVFEQAAELREVGAGLTLWANAIRALWQLGIAETVLALGSRLDSMAVRTWSGQIWATNNLASLERKLGVPAKVVAHRAILLRELAVCQAIEDAIVLADQLRRAGNTEGTLRAYEKLRPRRTARITTESFRMGRVGQWENSVACWLRNTGTRFFPQSASLRLMERFFKTALPEL